MIRRHEARLRRLEVCDPEKDWRHTSGLAALLAYAKAHPLAPWDIDPDEAPTGSMRRLLDEARQWQERER